MNLNELRDKAYKTACEHGFHDKALSNEHCLMLVITKLSEAVEADRKSKYANIPEEKRETIFDPRTFHEDNIYFMDNFEKFIKDTVEDELADACIRLFDLAGFINIDLEGCYMGKDVFPCTRSKGIFTEEMFAVCRILTNRIGFVENTISSTLGLLMIICHAYNIDIEWHIEQKMKYNSLLENLHGKKVLIDNNMIYQSNDSPFCQCPYCGSYNYVIGNFTSVHNCKCNDCGCFFFFKF